MPVMPVKPVIPIIVLFDHFLIGNTRYASNTGPQFAEVPAMTFIGHASQVGQTAGIALTVITFLLGGTDPWI